MKNNSGDTKSVIKMFWDWQYEKEEEWLNSMADQGWVLESSSTVFYKFRKCEPGEYTVRMGISRIKEECVKLASDHNAEFISSNMEHCFFRKKRADGEFTLFTTDDEKIIELKKLSERLTYSLIFAIMFSTYSTFTESLFFSIIMVFLLFISILAKSKISYKLSELQKTKTESLS